MTENFFRLAGDVPDIDLDEFAKRLSSAGNMENFLFRPDQLNRENLQERHTIGGAYKIKGKAFRNASFSKTELRGLVFQNCKFENCLFVGSSIVDCEFHDCQFVHTNMHKSKFSNTYVSPKSFAKCLDRRKHQNIGVHLYQSLMKNAKTSDQPDFEADARFLFIRWKRYQAIYDVNRLQPSTCGEMWSKLAAWRKISQSFVFELLFGSGIRFSNFVATATVVTFLFWLINWTCQKQLGLEFGSDGELSATSALYYTVISLTTVGYGDITPTTSSGHIWASIQGVVGFVMFALLASMFFRKIAP